MTYYEAALEVLRAAREPLTIQEITDRALIRGFIVPRGRTPQATMAAELYRRLATDGRLTKIGARGQTKRGTVQWALRE